MDGSRFEIRPLPIRTFNRAAVQDLYEAHGSALAAYLGCCGVDFASAQDIVQQVFLKLLRGKIAAPESVAAYLYRAVRNEWLNLRRNRRAEVEFNENEEWLVAPGGNREEGIALERALGSLPPEQREAVFLPR